MQGLSLSDHERVVGLVSVELDVMIGPSLCVGAGPRDGDIHVVLSVPMAEVVRPRARLANGKFRGSRRHVALASLE